MRLLNNKTIDKKFHDMLIEKKEHWKNVLVSIVVVIKTLAKNNLAFRGTNEKIYEENNEIFLNIMEMIDEFDPVMKEHLQRIQDKDIRRYYLGHNI